MGPSRGFVTRHSSLSMRSSQRHAMPLRPVLARSLKAVLSVSQSFFFFSCCVSERAFSFLRGSHAPSSQKKARLFMFALRAINDVVGWERKSSYHHCLAENSSLPTVKHQERKS